MIDNDINNKSNVSNNFEIFNQLSDKINSDWDLLFTKAREQDLSEDTIVNEVANLIHFCNDSFPIINIDETEGIEQSMYICFYLNTIIQHIYTGIRNIKGGAGLTRKIKIKVCQDTIDLCKAEEDDDK
jgi:hypothetical protein